MSVQGTIVYKDVFRLVNMLLDDMENMPVKQRRTLGDRILDTAYGLLSTLHFAYGATSSVERVSQLDRFQTEFGLLQTYLRIANERNWIPLTRMTTITELTVKISKQIGGWRKKSAGNSERGA